MDSTLVQSVEEQNLIPATPSSLISSFF